MLSVTQMNLIGNLKTTILQCIQLMLTMAPITDHILDLAGYDNTCVSQCLIIIKDNKQIWEMSSKRKENYSFKHRVFDISLLLTKGNST